MRAKVSITSCNKDFNTLHSIGADYQLAMAITAFLSDATPAFAAPGACSALPLPANGSRADIVATAMPAVVQMQVKSREADQ